MKPVTFPISFPKLARAAGGLVTKLRSSGRPLLGGSGRFLGRLLLRVHLGKRAAVFVGEHLHELRARRVPVIEDSERPRAAGEAQVAFDQLAQDEIVSLARMAQTAVPRSGKIL